MGPAAYHISAEGITCEALGKLVVGFEEVGLGWNLESRARGPSSMEV